MRQLPLHAQFINGGTHLFLSGGSQGITVPLCSEEQRAWGEAIWKAINFPPGFPECERLKHLPESEPRHAHA